MTFFLLIKLMSAYEFLLSEKYTNRQYLIFGVAITLAFFASIVAILFRSEKTDKGK